MHVDYQFIFAGSVLKSLSCKDRKQENCKFDELEKNAIISKSDSYVVSNDNTLCSMKHNKVSQQYGARQTHKWLMDYHVALCMTTFLKTLGTSYKIAS